MIFKFGEYELDRQRAELRLLGETIPLQRKVYLLLLFLIENRERMVTRDDILEEVWDGRIVAESTIDSRIKAARHAIGDNGTDQRLIKTLRGRGLRFVAQVSETGIQPADTIVGAPPRRSSNRPSIAVMPFEDSSSDLEAGYLVDGIGEDITFALGRIP